MCHVWEASIMKVILISELAVTVTTSMENKWLHALYLELIGRIKVVLETKPPISRVAACMAWDRTIYIGVP